MDQGNRIAPFAIVLALALVLQLALIAADCQQTPVRVAKQFARDYFYLDPAMQNDLCKKLAANGEAVNDFLYQKRIEAQNNGHSIKYLRKMFTEMEVEVENQTDTSANIHITGVTRTAINPAFMVVGKLFGLGQNFPVKLTLDLVKEDGNWRVCGNPFGMAPKA